MSTKIAKKVTINGEGINVVFDGITFTGDGHIEVQNAGSVTVQNCRVYSLNAPEGQSSWMKVETEAPVQIHVEHCYFGKNPAELHSLFEMNSKLLEGSEISDNYYAEDCCAEEAIYLKDLEQ